MARLCITAKKMFKHIFSGADDKINEYRTAFSGLKEDFDRDTAIHTESVAIMTQLDTRRVQLDTRRVLGLAENIGTRNCGTSSSC